MGGAYQDRSHEKRANTQGKGLAQEEFTLFQKRKQI
jgi:hypothetical protein